MQSASFVFDQTELSHFVRFCKRFLLLNSLISRQFSWNPFSAACASPHEKRHHQSKNNCKFLLNSGFVFPWRQLLQSYDYERFKSTMELHCRLIRAVIDRKRRYHSIFRRRFPARRLLKHLPLLLAIQYIVICDFQFDRTLRHKISFGKIFGEWPCVCGIRVPKGSPLWIPRHV